MIINEIIITAATDHQIFIRISQFTEIGQNSLIKKIQIAIPESLNKR